MILDVLAVGAHPDDADLGVGGTLCKLAQAGHAVGILDLTRGELSSRGTVEERQAEADAAAKALGLTTRVNADLPDGRIANTPGCRDAVMQVVCRLKPKVVLAHMPTDRHPDHRAAHALTRDASFFAGVARMVAPEEPHRAEHVFYYHPYYQSGESPQFVVDISDEFDRKIDALKQFGSQFHNPAYAGRETHVSSPAFWEQVRVRAEYWGGRIGVRYGEPFYADGPLALDLVPGLGVRA